MICLSGHRFRSVALTTGWIALVASCERELEGQRCPCLEDQVCCTAENRCRRRAAECALSLPTAGEGGGGPTMTMTGGTSPPSGDGGGDGGAPAANGAASGSESDAGAGDSYGEGGSGGSGEATSRRRVELPRYCNWAGFCGARYPFSAVWGTAANDVWALAKDESENGERQAFLRYDGEHWRNVPNFTQRDDVIYRAIWGSTPESVWFVGSDVYNEVRTGNALRFENGNWTGSFWLKEVGELAAIWGSARDDIWVVGKRGAPESLNYPEPVGEATSIAHYDGSRWSAFPLTANVDLDAVWGSGKDDIWAAGANGAILHWDGFGWNVAQESGRTEARLNAIWGSAKDDVWIAGDDRTLLHFDGAEFSAVDLENLVGADVDLRAVGGRAAGDVWVATSEGDLLHLEGNGWSASSVRAEAALEALWVAPSGEVWAVGEAGVASHWDGEQFFTAPAAFTDDFVGVWAAGSGDVWAIGAAGTIVHSDGTQWSQVTSPEVDALEAIWGTAPDDVWAVGSQILHFDGKVWSVEPSDTSHRLRSVWASAPNDAVAVGDHGTVLRWDGTSWAVDERWLASDRFETKDFSSVWGSGSSDVWAIFADDNGVRWDGDTWSWAYIASGSLSRTGTGQAITGSASDDIWLVQGYREGNGDAMEIRFWNGRTWHTLHTIVPWWGTPRAAASSGTGKFWLVGAGGIWRANISADQLYRADDVTLAGVWARSDDEVWVVGSKGTLLAREPIIEAGYADLGD